MIKTVGVRSWIDTFRSPSIKREALMFDQIGITQLDIILEKGRGHSKSDSDIDDLEWLCENDIVFDLGTTKRNEQRTGNEEFDKYNDSNEMVYRNLQTALVERLLSYERKGNQKIKKISSAVERQDAKVDLAASMASDYDARCAAIRLRETPGIQAFPILSSLMPSIEDTQANKIDVIQITLNALPQPSEIVPWEDIIEFRNDASNAHHLLALRNWINETANMQLTPQESEEKIEYLVSQYGQHMNLHKMKFNLGTLETVVVASAEFLEHMVKFKWGRTAQSLFSFKHRRIALMEGELTAPGNQLAYIEKARQTF